MDFYPIMLERVPELQEFRRTLHRHPELSNHEFETARFVERKLDEWGIPHERVGETGVYAEIRGGLGEGRTVALRADMDALPIQEENDVPYRSECPGVMHACGHDMHTSSLLAAAKALQENRDKFAGSVRLMFQQAEEIGEGARLFVRGGKMDGVDRIFGIHTAPDLKLGTVGVKSGPNNASVDCFKVKIHGKAAHVSTPQLGADALFVAAQSVVALQSLITRRTSPIDSVIIGVGKLTAGTAYNIVAEEAYFEGTTRLFTAALRRDVNDMVTRTIHAVAELYGAKAEIEWLDFTPPLENPEDICREVRPVVADMLGADAVVTDRALSCGGDNFADFQLAAPGVYAYVGVRSPEVPGSEGPLHNSHYNIDERALPIGAALYAQMAWHWLAEN